MRTLTLGEISGNESLKYAVQVNGVTELIMMKADVLSGFETGGQGQRKGEKPRQQVFIRLPVTKTQALCQFHQTEQSPNIQ